MKTEPEYLGVLAILTLILVLTLALHRRVYKKDEQFLNLELPLLQFNIVKPTLYWFCDSDKNARDWNDFGSRMSMHPNRGYLNIALNKAYKTQKEFTIVPLIGRDAVFTILPNLNRKAKQLPTKLWREYVIANILYEKGGLVMDGDSTLCTGKSFYPIIKDLPAATFGINPDEPAISVPTSLLPGPAPYVGWAKDSYHPAWSYSAKAYNSLVERGPQAWTAALARRMNQSIWEVQHAKGCIAVRNIDGGRLMNGKMRQLEDIFGRVTEPENVNTLLHPDTVFISYDGEDLQRRYEFNWFLRLSQQQIKESEFVWAKLAL